MFTGLVTVGVVYFGIGLIWTIVQDDSGNASKMAAQLFKSSTTWPKDLYDKYLKD